MRRIESYWRLLSRVKTRKYTKISRYDQFSWMIRWLKANIKRWQNEKKIYCKSKTRANFFPTVLLIYFLLKWTKVITKHKFLPILGRLLHVFWMTYIGFAMEIVHPYSTVSFQASSIKLYCFTAIQQCPSMTLGKINYSF